MLLILRCIFYTCTLWTTALGQASGSIHLPVWQPGFLDIHHIQTGRGNAAFMIFPDGTTLLMDAGDISDTHPRTTSPRNSSRMPDGSRTAPEWIIDYIRQFHPSPSAPRLDYALITHFHDDHFGEWDSTRPLSAKAAYVLTGIMAIGDSLPIGTLIDRNTQQPIPVFEPPFTSRYAADDYHIVQTLQHYQRFIKHWQKANGLRHEALEVGSRSQIKLQKNARAWPAFSVTGLAAGGRIFTGFDTTTYHLYAPGHYPGENPLSTCIKISYGAFDYFAGGDISGIDGHGQANTASVEAALAVVTGPVDVATLNHHGNRDAMSPVWVSTLRPLVWIGQSWSSDHPGEEVLRRLTSQQLYPGPRYLFATDMLEANRLVIGEKINQSYSSQQGHVVVRVQPGGHKYTVYVLDAADTERRLKASFGPFSSR